LDSIFNKQADNQSIKSKISMSKKSMLTIKSNLQGQGGEQKTGLFDEPSYVDRKRRNPLVS
jgi:hypothetical protein